MPGLPSTAIFAHWATQGCTDTWPLFVCTSGNWGRIKLLHRMHAHLISHKISFNYMAISDTFDKISDSYFERWTSSLLHQKDFMTYDLKIYLLFSWIFLSSATRDTILMTKAMAEAGADAVMVVTPCYFKSLMNNQALGQHYTKVNKYIIKLIKLEITRTQAVSNGGSRIS